MDSRQKSLYLGSITSKVVLTLLAIGILYFWVFGKAYPAYNKNYETADVIIKDIEHITEKGLETEKEIRAFLDPNTKKLLEKISFEVIEGVLIADLQTTEETDAYLDRLKELNKRGATVGNRNREKKEEIIGSIIPTLGSLVEHDKEDKISNRITLRNFLEYVETDLLAQFEINSVGEAGISNIDYLLSEEDLYVPGTFTISMPFESSIENIYGLLDHTKTLGSIPLTDEGDINISGVKSIESPSFSALDNLLVLIDTVTINKILPSDEDDLIDGKIDFRFYIKTPNFSEVQAIINALQKDLLGDESIGEVGLLAELEETANFCVENEDKCRTVYVKNTVDNIKSLVSLAKGVSKELRDIDEKSSTYADSLELLKEIGQRLDAIRVTFEAEKLTLEKTTLN